MRPIHGQSGTPLYKVWSAMKQRCDLPTNDFYSRYGKRGISYFPAWSKFVPFRDWALDNGYEKGLYLDRENNDGNYEPSNCRWIHSSQNQLNSSNTKRKLVDVACIKVLLGVGVKVKLISALFDIDMRRVCDIRDGKKWAWVDPLTTPL
jgi:hypothetical protein